MNFLENPFQTKVGDQVLNLREHGLSDRLFSQLQTKYYLRGEPYRCFLSMPELRDIYTPITVWHLLHQQHLFSEYELADVVAQILNHKGPRASIKILAVLNLIGHVQHLRIFYEGGIYDDDLPLAHESEAYNRLLLSGCGYFELIYFCSQQWHVLVPVFDLTSPAIQKHVFMPKARMPFLEQELKSRGGQGRILKVKIHTNHILATNLEGPDFAVKQFDLHQRRLWQDEVTALTTLSRPEFKDKHLIRLLCAFEHQEHGLFLIFPLAEGSLSDYWASSLSQSRLVEGPRWLLEQCSGIACGLSKIHSAASGPAVRLGRHGDIKPGNILWFRDSDLDHGHLVLADFTSTRFHSSETVDNSSTGTWGITRTYSPPEVELKPKIRRTQAYDVWSLACVYLEFLTWYLLGNAAIREQRYIHTCGEECHSFAHLRFIDDEHHYWEAEDRFFNITHRDGTWVAIVKDSVKQWIRMLHRSERCSKALHEFLELIEKSMLVVPPTKRLSVERVSIELTKILNKALVSDYCLTGCPWPVSENDLCHPPCVEEEEDEALTRPRTRSWKI